MKGLYKIADEIVEIETLYPDTHEMLKDYKDPLQLPLKEGRAQNDSDSVDYSGKIIHIVTCAEDIEKEQAMSDEEMRFEGHEEIQYPKGYLETLAVYRKLCAQMASRGVILMHGSVIAVDGEGYLFTAASGTGKSTHVRLWRKLFGERAVMVNDDKPLVRVKTLSNSPLKEEDAELRTDSKNAADSKRVIVYGTPWDGKHRLSTNISVPLKAICILERGAENEIHKITPQEAFPMLIQQSHRPEDPAAFIASMQLLGEVAKNTGLYRLHCNMEEEAAKVSYEGMQ